MNINWGLFPELDEPLRDKGVKRARKLEARQAAFAHQPQVYRLHALIIRCPTMRQQIADRERNDLCIASRRESGWPVAARVGLQRAPQIHHVDSQDDIGILEQLGPSLGRLESVLRREIEARPQIDEAPSARADDAAKDRGDGLALGAGDEPVAL